MPRMWRSIQIVAFNTSLKPATHASTAGRMSALKISFTPPSSRVVSSSV
jgi:hypothetical protein